MDDKRLDLEALFRLPSAAEKGRSPERDATRRALIAALPVHPLRNGHVLSALHDPMSPATEQYRTVKARLDYISRNEGRAIHTIVVTSPSPGDGKTLTALNLALVLAQDESKAVLIIDADLRKPGLRDYFAHRPKIGLIELLAREVGLSAGLFRLDGSRLVVLPSGARATNPAELLSSPKMEELLRVLASRFDYVIIDTPPVGAFVDADGLAAVADATILVVRSGQTLRRRVAQAVETVSKHRFLGVILNDLRHTPLDRYYNRRDYYYYQKKK
jgi:capsular exopolysaccharide synthesis family protein